MRPQIKSSENPSLITIVIPNREPFLIWDKDVAMQLTLELIEANKVFDKERKK